LKFGFYHVQPYTEQRLSIILQTQDEETRDISIQDI